MFRARLTDEVQTQILAAIATAAPREVAAGYAGVTAKTLWQWLQLGGPEQACVSADDPQHRAGVCDAPGSHAAGACPYLSRFRDFREAVERAEQALHIKLAGEVVKAASRDWRAAMAVLKARWPKTWNVPQIAQLQGGIEVEVTLSVRDSLRAKLEELHERGLLALPSPAGDDAERLDSDDEAEGPAPTHSPREQEHRDRRKRPSFA